MEITGILELKKDTVEVGAKGFKKREFVLLDNSNDNYPQYIAMEFIQDKVDLLDNVNIGDEIEISFNLNGRKWESPEKGTMYFNTLQAWKLTNLSDKDDYDDYIPDARPINGESPAF
jgi:hypothetical protein